MSIQKCIYIGKELPIKAVFEEALWDFFDIVKGTVKIQFDNLSLAPLCYGWHEVPLSDVVIKINRTLDNDQG